ncbi:MAG: 7,8-dihydropterin-6-yl-methyl-4-(beta-D-ribofuranosyl)aminobenzene 5-phosphate synthase [Thermosipho sp. (in: thermotogales)]|nr:7,8-dihydropterin-6-yl-methyl-4-(beta-D-ribofuranosyl)aminobenzene 5-phosphate synthase [Thermosipho sp. (in: thermotogales)]MDN5324929.1 7,8-dihydropterin-6-yl-methyl-4-(beta-D-ribofuranosyl)aminobenzene 5-phosphate synthase [Thermosipho sp. (in: thermotogales)]
MEIKILCNDTAKEGFYYEHGLSILINKNILFDTGQSDVFIKNGRLLNVDFSEIKEIYISHGHYDHIGGLINLVGKTDATVYVHNKALLPKFNGQKFVGIPYEWDLIPFRIKYIYQDTDINNIHVINSVPITKNVVNKKFNINGKQDLFEDEINLIIENVLFTGCAHRGIENILQHVLKNYTIKAVIGGFHLNDASLKRIKNIIQLFKTHNLYVFPLHCTGEKTTKIIKNELKEKCIILKAGDEWREL